ncbi:hypothetical protein Droror1_Dr00009556 [Drosera rotundifolia]
MLGLQRSVKHQEEAQSLQAIFPLIDPLDAFYLLNPSGDLNNTQVEFEEWFKSEQLQVTIGVWEFCTAVAKFELSAQPFSSNFKFELSAQLLPQKSAAADRTSKN